MLRFLLYKKLRNTMKLGRKIYEKMKGLDTKYKNQIQDCNIKNTEHMTVLSVFQVVALISPINR